MTLAHKLARILINGIDGYTGYLDHCGVWLTRIQLQFKETLQEEVERSLIAQSREVNVN